MDKKRVSFKEQFLLGYTTGSILFFILSFLLGAKMDFMTVQTIHIMLLCGSLAGAYIWSKYYWIGMPKRDVWKIRCTSGSIQLIIFWIVFFIRALLRNGIESTLNTYPQTMLLSGTVSVILFAIWYIIIDYLEKLALKQINAKLSENRSK